MTDSPIRLLNFHIICISYYYYWFDQESNFWILFYFLIFSISIVKSNCFIIYSSNYCFFMQKYNGASLGICFVGTKASGLIVRVYLRHKTHISRKEFDIVSRIENQSALLMLLTYFSPVSQFYIPWKRQKTIRFQWV